MNKNIAYAARVWRLHNTCTHRGDVRKQPIKCPLRVSVFNWRVSSTTYGFLTDADRRQAFFELRNRFGAAVTLTDYRDVNAHFAAQVIVWEGDVK